MTTKGRIVIVGGGLAGLRAAERLRELDYDGELVIIGAEHHRPYHRPALSKQLLTGDLHPRDLALRDYVRLRARWRTGTSALHLDTRRRVVELPGAEELRYDGLVIATGMQPRHLPGSPRHDPRVHQLRTMEDAIGLRRALATCPGRVVVIGGGFTGCEVASTAREMGREVTIVSRTPTLLGQAFGKRFGESIANLHRAGGVSLALGVRVSHWVPQQIGIGLHLSDGQLLVAGCVVVAIGSVPAVQWLRGSGLTLEDGVLCRPSCHVVGANDVVAAGDVARWPNLRFEAVPRRLEHWINAVEMGRAAAESLLAGATAARPFTPLPRFWSEQHGVRLQAAGMPGLGERPRRLSGTAGGRGVVGYVRRGRLIGIVGWESPRAMLHWTSELERELNRPHTMPDMPGWRAAFGDSDPASADQQPVGSPPIPGAAPLSRQLTAWRSRQPDSSWSGAN